jgi:hypothetical protein
MTHALAGYFREKLFRQQGKGTYLFLTFDFSGFIAFSLGVQLLAPLHNVETRMASPSKDSFCHFFCSMPSRPNVNCPLEAPFLVSILRLREERNFQ